MYAYPDIMSSGGFWFIISNSIIFTLNLSDFTLNLSDFTLNLSDFTLNLSDFTLNLSDLKNDSVEIQRLITPPIVFNSIQSPPIRAREKNR